MLSDHALLAILTGLNGLQLVVLVWSLTHHRKPSPVLPAPAPHAIHVTQAHGPHGPVR